MTTEFRPGGRVPFTSKLATLPDPPKKRDMRQEPDATYARYVLRSRIEEIAKTGIVRGCGYLRTRMTPIAEWELHLFPDVMVAFDVDAGKVDRRNAYIISEVGKPPEFVMELATEMMGRRDCTIKRDGYAWLGVPEYWRFDRTGGKLHDAALAGDRLVNGRYEPIEVTLNDDGVYSGFSPAIGLALCWVDGKLRFRNPYSGEYAPTYTESVESRVAVAQARIQAAELEASRLRERLARYESN